MNQFDTAACNPFPKLISVVLPIYNEALILPALEKRIDDFARTMPAAIDWIFVNDGSQDGSIDYLLRWAIRNPNIKIIDFARNFGHQMAITAGIDQACGDVVVTMDSDLQDPPELIHKMIQKYQEGYDVVYAQRTRRHGEGYFKRATAFTFYWLMRKVARVQIPREIGDFRLMSKGVVAALGSYREGSRFLRGMIPSLGYRQTAVLYERPGRIAGESKFPFIKMFAFAIDGIVSLSRRPLHIPMYFAAVIFISSFTFAIYRISASFFFHVQVPTWHIHLIFESQLAAAILFCQAVQGEYTGRIHGEVQARPLYIVSRMVNIQAKSAPRAVLPEDLLGPDGIHMSVSRPAFESGIPSGTA